MRHDGSTRARMDTSRPLRPRDKLLLAVEVLGAYVRVRRDLGHGGATEAFRSLPRPIERDDQRLLAVRVGRAVDRTPNAVPLDSPGLVRPLVLARTLARRDVGSKVVL